MATIGIFRDTNINDIKANTFVAVNNATAASQTSVNGRTWVSRTMPGAAINWLGVAYGETDTDQLCVAVTSGVRSAVSFDGTTWYSGGLPSLNSWNAIAFGSGRFVTVAGNTLRSAYTTDGFNWTSGNLGIVGDWRTLKFNNNKFIAIGYNSDKYITSYDGLTWVSGSMPSVQNWSSFTYDESTHHYIAVANGSNVIAHSDDGITWSGGTIYTSSNWSSITSNGSGMYVAVSATTGVIGAYSQGGFTWSSGTLGASGCSFKRVTYSPEEKIFVAHTANTTNAVYSYTGIDWYPMVVITGNVNDCCYAPFSWRSVDLLEINNGKTMTINTDMSKAPSRININQGLLNVVNESTSPTGCIRFVLTRTDRGALPTYVWFANGLGSCIISGKMIDTGIGSGLPGQVIDIPYTDYVSNIWVETGYNTNTYEIWCNALNSYGNNMRWSGPDNGGLELIGSGRCGMFYTQLVNPVFDNTIRLNNCSGTVGSRFLTVPSTSGILTGASVSGYTAVLGTSVVERIVSSTVLELNTGLTTSSNTISVDIFNPFKEQLQNKIRCGDGFYGAVFPSGARIRVPNILCSVDTPVNFHYSSYGYNALQLLCSNGPKLIKLHNCIFDDSYNIFTQTQELDIDHVCFALPPLITEIYNLSINSLGSVHFPSKRYFTGSYWASREYSKYANSNSFSAMAYISNAVINDICFGFLTTNFIAAADLLKITGADNIRITNARFYVLTQTETGRYTKLTYVTNSVFENFECYGAGGFYLLTSSSNNTITNTTISESLFNTCHKFTNTFRLKYDPTTGQDMIAGQRYYFKTRSFYTKDQSIYSESPVHSATPFLGARNFPNYVTCNCNGSQSVLLGWDEKLPYFMTEIYRGTTEGFTRDLTSMVCKMGVSTLVTWTNGPCIEAVPTAGTDTWTWNATNKTLTRSNGGAGTSFITLGFNTGDVIDVTETLNNNRTLIITAVTATVMTFAAVGDTIQTIVGESASTVGKINGRVPVNGTKYYYVLRKYDSLGVYNESPEIEVTPTEPLTSTNLVLQNRSFNVSPWVTSNITVTAAQAYSPVTPHDNPIASLTADKITATKNNGIISQPITTVSGVPYTFSVYYRNDPSITVPIVSGFIGLSGSVSNFPKTLIEASGAWTRSSVTIVASGTSTTAMIGIDTSGQYMMVDSAMLNSGVIALPPVPTATIPITTPYAQDISVLSTWCRSDGDETDFSGIAFSLASRASGVIVTAMYCGTSGEFEPSNYNKLFDTYDSSNYGWLVTEGSSNNVFDTLKQYGRSSIYYSLVYSGDSVNNIFKNITYDFGTWSYTAALCYFAGTSSNIIVANMNVMNLRNYAAYYPITAGNTVSNITLQNINTNKTDYAYYPFGQNIITKGMGCANASIYTGNTSYGFGSTVDGIAKSYVTVYDTIFNELHFTETSGCLHLLFNASTSDTPPYTIISGSPSFSNLGKLYLPSFGDSIEYTWPHKIIGVSGFSSDREPKTDTVDFGTDPYQNEGLKLEYNLNTGSGYNGYKLMTASNLGSEVVSASSGFYLQVKITALTGMKYGAKVNDFVVGERIRGLSSMATATVDAHFLNTTLLGTIQLSNISGVFGASEIIVRDSDGEARATNVATNAEALFPSYTSLIGGLQFYTLIDKTVKYPVIEVDTHLTLTGLQPGSEVRIYKCSDNSYLGGIESSTDTFTYNYKWDDIVGDTLVYIRIMALNYKWLTFTNETLGQEGLTIPVIQELDRQYYNP